MDCPSCPLTRFLLAALCSSLSGGLGENVESILRGHACDGIRSEISLDRLSYRTHIQTTMTAQDFITRRKACGLTQAGAALLLEVTVRTIDRWEHGRTKIDELRADAIRRRFAGVLADQEHKVTAGLHRGEDRETGQ